MNTDTLTTAKELEAKGVEHTAAEAIAVAIHNHTQTQCRSSGRRTDSTGPFTSGLSRAESANKPADLAQLIVDFPQ